MVKARYFQLALTLLVLLGFGVISTSAQATNLYAAASSAFTYQGQLKDGRGDPVTAACSFNFSLWDALTGGSQVGTTVSKPEVAVSSGLFSVQLDFGFSPFAGDARWLEVAVQCPGDPAFTTLAPRQELTAAPYALYAATAGNAGTVTNGVYTTGSYADPGWLTSLSGSKINGAVANAANAAAVTNGVYTTGSYADPGWLTSLAGGKINGAVASAANADTLDGYHAADLRQQYMHRIVVAKSGGDFTTITAALNSISDNDADHTYLIYVAPGKYTEQVTMKPYVDIEGAGETSTKISTAGFPSSNTGTVIGASSSELRYLTVENTGNNINGIVIYSYQVTSARFTHITVIAPGYVADSYLGVYNNQSSPAMRNVTISITGSGNNSFAVKNVNSNPDMQDVKATTSGGSNIYGVYNMGSSPTMKDVYAAATEGYRSYAIYNESSSSPIMMGVSAVASGSNEAVGIYNVLYSSPKMSNVIATASEATNTYGIYSINSSYTMSNFTATASGGTNNYGVYNLSSSTTMIGVTATASAASTSGTTACGVYNDGSSPAMTSVSAGASGGGSTIGVWNHGGSSPVMMNVTATASSGNVSDGMLNDASSPTILNSLVTGSGGTLTNNGMENKASSGTHTVRINNSKISGFNSTIYSNVSGTGNYTTYIAASQIGGGGVFGAGAYSYVCTGAFNDSYGGLSNICK